MYSYVDMDIWVGWGSNAESPRIGVTSGNTRMLFLLRFSTQEVSCTIYCCTIANINNYDKANRFTLCEVPWPQFTHVQEYIH